MEQLSIGSSSDLIEHRGLKIDIDRSRDILSIACIRNWACNGLPVSEKNVLRLPFSVWLGFKRPSGYLVRTRPMHREKGKYGDSMLETVEL
jgi:hypothetical protein